MPLPASSSLHIRYSISDSAFEQAIRPLTAITAPCPFLSTFLALSFKTFIKARAIPNIMQAVSKFIFGPTQEGECFQSVP